MACNNNFIPNVQYSNFANIPHEFEDPFSLEIMENAVMGSCGHSFEFKEIFNYLQKKQECPLDRKTLKVEELIPNYNLREGIENYKYILKIREIAFLLLNSIEVDKNQLNSLLTTCNTSTTFDLVKVIFQIVCENGMTTRELEKKVKDLKGIDPKIMILEEVLKKKQEHASNENKELLQKKEDLLTQVETLSHQKNVLEAKIKNMETKNQKPPGEPQIPSPKAEPNVMPKIEQSDGKKTKDKITIIAEKGLKAHDFFMRNVLIWGFPMGTAASLVYRKIGDMESKRHKAKMEIEASRAPI
jgi:hypothetical protein